MPTDIQLAKAYGNATHVMLRDVNRESARAEVTQELAQIVRERQCGHPDAPDQEIALADPGDLRSALDLPLDHCQYLQIAHSQLWAYNNERWPKNCFPNEHPNEHAVKIYIDWDSFPSHNMRLCTDSELNQIVESKVWRITIEEVKDRWSSMPMAKVAQELSDMAYARLGVRHVHLDEGVGDQVHTKAEPIPGGVIGFAYFPSGQCGDHVTQTLDTIQFSLMGLARLICHEMGHNHGEQHQFNGQSSHHSVMSYDPPRLFYGFATGNDESGLPRDRSLDSLIEKYGGEPIDPVPLPPVPPIPPSDRPAISYSDRGVVIDGHTYLLTPRPRV